MKTVITRSNIRTAPCARPVVLPQVTVSRVPRSSTQCKAVTEVATVAVNAGMIPIVGIPSAAAVYFAARYIIPAYQNFAPSAPSAVPQGMPEYKHRSVGAATTSTKMKNGKKAYVPLKGSGTIHLKRR